MIDLDIRSSGASEQQLVQGLNGTASYEFIDGAIRGINIPQMLRGLSVETLLGWQENPSEKTDFSSLAASFQIDKGIARDRRSVAGRSACADDREGNHRHAATIPVVAR